MDRRKKIVACVAAVHMLLSMMATIVASRKRKREENRRIGISYGPMAERDRMRIEYLNTKIWKNDTTCINMLRISRARFFRFCKVFRDRGLLEDTIHMCVEQQVAMFLNTVGHNLRNRLGETVSRYFNKVLHAISELRNEFIRPPSLDTPSKIAGNPRWDPYFKMFVSFGLLLSYVSSYAFAGMPVHLSWRVMYAAGVLPPFFLAAGVLAMPESPRWLAMRGREAEARDVLVRTSDTPAEADLRLQEIIKQAARKAPHNKLSDVDDDGNDGGVWKELLVHPSASVRRMLVCVVGIHFFQQASGIDAIVLYTPLVLRKAGMSSNDAILGATVAVGVSKMSFILVATLLSDRLGRRPLLLASTGGVAVAMASLGLALGVGPTSAATTAACISSVLAFMAAFSIGFGPMTGTYSTEIMPLRLRAQGTSLGNAVNRLTCGLVSMTFISLADWITMPGCFFLYAGVAATAFLFVYKRLPETRGRSLEDMEVLFAK